MKKALIRIGIGLLLLLIVAVAVSVYYLGRIVKNRVETVGSSVAQVEVKLDSADVWLLAGRAQLKGLSVGNPPSWKTRIAVQVGDITIRVKSLSVLSDKPVIESIIVKSPEITIEGGLKNNNLAQIRKNVSAYNSADSSQTAAAPSASSPASAKKFQINELTITGARLHVMSLFSTGKNVTIPLPDIHLVSLGAGPSGITSPEVAQKALTALLDSIADNAAVVLPKLGKDAASTVKKFDFKKAGERLKSLFGQ
jgi:uncharacterized protein involved in outer membrane biogenesis